MKTLLTICVFLVTLLITGCYPGPESPRGFSLPTGDVEAGQQVFLKYNCLACHTIDSVEDPFIESELGVTIHIGGMVSQHKTYADLVTSVINPSHRLADQFETELVAEDGISKMTNYNDVMTVTELIDLVAFLQPHFELVEFQPTTYAPYH